MSLLGYSVRSIQPATPLLTPPACEHPGVITASQLCSTLDSCDLLFFQGESWTSVLTSLVTGSRFSHVAMSVRDLQTHYRFLWESVYHADPDLVDVYTQSGSKAGVRLVEAESSIISYGRRNNATVISVGVLKFHVDAPLCPADHAKLMLEIDARIRVFQDQEHPKPFEQSPYNLARAGLKVCRFVHRISHSLQDFLGANPIRPTREYFCSNLVVSTFQHVGIMDKKYNPNEATPASLAHYPNRLPLETGFRLGPELLIYKVSIPPKTAAVACNSNV